MDLFTWDMFSYSMIFALFQVILIDLVMSGDNAMMIGVTTQWLKKQDRKKAIFLGVIGAALMRIVFAFWLAQLLDVPVVKIIWSLLLFFVAVKLYKQFRNDEKNTKAHKTSANRRHALGMIIIADISMSLDNILAVASAAGEHPIALIVWIVISIIMMTTIATAIWWLLDRYPWIKWFWFALIVFLAFKMLFASVANYVPEIFHTITYRLIGMFGTFGMIFLHRKYMSTFEQHEVTKILYNHAPFIITVLLLIIASFLIYWHELQAWLDIHQAVWVTIFTCIFLLALEMASLESVKHKVKLP